MKILTIKFKNINNLKGENVISFQDDPLRSAGIFAITGPTGSGKSTLLDVITLALFNKIPRFKGTISKTSIEGLGSVVTHHTDEAEASITYEIHNQKYTSSWTVGKTRTGKFKDYEMFIYDANGTPLDLKKSEVPGKNEAIIGLKYDQFVKSIILSQGQFSRFLKADKSERGQLLENLTGASIYRKISIAAYEKYKLVRDEVALEKDRLENIQTLSEEERKEIASSIKSNDVDNALLEKELGGYIAARQLKSEMGKMTQSLAVKKIEKENLIHEKEKFKAKLDQLNLYERLSPILGDLTRYADAKKKQKQLLVEVENNQKLLVESEQLRNGVIAEMANLTQKTINAENFHAEMSAFEKEVNSLNQEIAYIQNSGIETRKRINNKAAHHRIEIDPKAGPESAISSLNQNLEISAILIKSAGFDLDVDIQKVNDSYAGAKEELDALNGLKIAYENEVNAKKRIDKSSNDLKNFQEEKNKYKPIVEASQKLITAVKENIALLEKQKQDAMLIAKLSDHRTQLVDGEPCPLCGALDHPFAEHHPEGDSNFSSLLEAAKKNLLDHENEFATYNRKLTQSLASIQVIENQLTQLEEELKMAIKTRSEKYASYEGPEAKDPESIELSINNVEQKVKQYSEAGKAVQNRSAIQELIKYFDELAQVLTKYSQLDKQLKSKYSGSDVSRDCNQLQDKFVRTNTRIATLNTELEKDKSALAQVEEFINTTFKKLDPQVKSLGFSSIEETEAFMISEEELKYLKLKKEELNQKGTAIETEIKTLIKQISSSEKQDTYPEMNLSEVNQTIKEKSGKREALIKSIGEKSAILQKDDQEKERVKSKESELRKLQEKLDKWSLVNKLIGEKTGNKFANFAQGLTLQNLLVYANKRLQKLSDRYLLDKPIKDGALTVIDQYQGNIQRSVSTLSGGESFLISLALALSLSDMASKNVNLESLFIDEGFGTLDQESLDVAMNTLERLQTESQKTVGVISHVEALKERIHVQIKLDKNAQGYGTIKIEG